MITLPCPWCGPRNSQEFAYGGETAARPDPETTSPETWRRYLYEHTNPCGWVDENWYHRAGCRRYLKVRRHTLTNEVAATEPALQRRGEEQ